MSDESDERLELSPAQAAWIEPRRERLRDDPRREPGCFGCNVYGLCALHASKPRIEVWHG